MKAVAHRFGGRWGSATESASAPVFLSELAGCCPGGDDRAATWRHTARRVYRLEPS
ncbi:hypothetical protein [Micromonospora sp. ATCC 39149]|uniref:Uncharacterized protein n=1 Tax=Micromonospora carbonacea TaxID=47853 RepID=A0A7D5YD44_9ACTN|nr:hypothetical protein [Micromonospora sp. ATCC 39149]QLJ96736.1 hypothetical protein HZU44_17680 [Micromonospora carbonacea]